jgi:gliding motility-associated-like protein
LGYFYCKNKQTFTVTDSEKATITNVQVFDFNEENSFEVKFTGNGSYVFSIDGIHFQNSPFFQNVAIGEYTVIIKDQKNCGITTSSPFYVLDYPRFFTPNQDGFNDYWQIKNLDKQPKSIISIFDRFGKLLQYFSGAGDGWNGTYNGNLLPADDYWFCLELFDGRKIKGHFTLKR